jgi:TRAP-type C4-dicarboxylate transport system substrate-binding protein
MKADYREEPREKPVTLAYHNIHEHGVGIAGMWMDEVTARTGGRVRFTPSSGEDPQAIEVADIVRDVPAGNTNYRLLNLIQVPFIFPGATVGSRVIAQLYREFAALREELSDVKIVGLSIGALMAIFSSRAQGPIRNLEDFKGARIRSLRPIDGFIEALGARPLQVPYLQISRLLASGELDATVLGLLPAKMFGLAEGAAPYATVFEGGSISMHPMRLYMKWETWRRLPPDVQAVMEKIGPAGDEGWFTAHAGPDADESLRGALEYIERYGEMVRIAGAEMARWRRRIQPRIDAVLSEVEAAGRPGRKFFHRMNELVAEYS